jgi:hypothetical protein
MWVLLIKQWLLSDAEHQQINQSPTLKLRCISILTHCHQLFISYIYNAISKTIIVAFFSGTPCITCTNRSELILFWKQRTSHLVYIVVICSLEELTKNIPAINHIRTNFPRHLHLYLPIWPFIGKLLKTLFDGTISFSIEFGWKMHFLNFSKKDLVLVKELM